MKRSWVVKTYLPLHEVESILVFDCSVYLDIYQGTVTVMTFMTFKNPVQINDTYSSLYLVFLYQKYQMFGWGMYLKVTDLKSLGIDVRSPEIW